MKSKIRQMPEFPESDAKKHYVFTISCCVFAKLRIITFPLRKTQFGEVQKGERRILINTDVYEDFRSPFQQNVKSLCGNHWFLQCFAMRFRPVPNHYFFLGKTQF